ncbi:MAG: NAD(P)-dependent oxidoreductase [Candidatus Bathyarchaeia archaeon]
MKNEYKIGIIGGSGFVGSSLAKHLIKKFKVKIIDIKRPIICFPGKLEYTTCDLRSYEEVEKALADVNLAIHTAIVQIPLINEQKKLGYEVNILGTQNICKAIDNNPQCKGLLLTGSWHTIGEKELKGVIDEEFGFRPDKVEDRARLYAISKIAQEAIVRFYDEMSDKIFGIIRMGTVLGEGMPEKTAANIFIDRGLRGETITPYKHSMHRPMLYVDIEDIQVAFERFALKILESKIKKENNSLANIVNVYYPEPITIIELAEIVQQAIIKHTKGLVNPKIEIIDTGQHSLFEKEDKQQIKVDTRKALSFLDLNKIKSPEKTINKIIKKRIAHASTKQF